MKKFMRVLALVVCFVMMLSMSAFAASGTNILETNGVASTRDFEIIYDEYYTFSSYYTIQFEIKTSGYYNVWLLTQEKTTTGSTIDFLIVNVNNSNNQPVKKNGIAAMSYEKWDKVYFVAGTYCARYIATNGNAVYYGNLYVHKS